MRHLVLLFCLIGGLLTPLAPAGLALKDGDRVAFIGNTFVEREQDDCYIETMLTTRFPDRNITFRNLGYSADTVTGSARGLCAGWSTFENDDKAFDRLRKLVAEFKPTVLLMNYGMTESFSGPEGIPTFVSNYNKMLDALSKAAGTSPRIVLMSPNYHEDLGRPLPDPSDHNKNLELYTRAIGQIAGERHCGFVDVFALTQAASKTPIAAPLTSNGIHLTPYGYWRTALALVDAVDGPKMTATAKLNADGKLPEDAQSGLRLSDISAAPGRLTFTATRTYLPFPALPGDAPKVANDAALGGGLRLAVSGLKAGDYELKCGGRVLAKDSSQQWAKGVAIDKTGPDAEQVEALRKLIVAKNFDFFNYQRPDNDSYILAFRRGEQGRNAVEIPRFLPLVEEKEKQIAALRAPRPVIYTLEAVK